MRRCEATAEPEGFRADKAATCVVPFKKAAVLRVWGFRGFGFLLYCTAFLHAGFMFP